MAWPRKAGCVVFTHDMDYGALLAATNAESPSVVQIRTQKLMPQHVGDLLLTVLKDHGDALAQGALIVIDEARRRVRLLPLNQP